MSLNQIPSNQINRASRSSSRRSVFQYLRGLSRKYTSHNSNSNKEEFYSQEFRQLLSFFNVSYYTLVTPFRIAKAKDGLYKIQTSILQQICVAILNIVAVTILIREELGDVRENILEKPEQLFQNIKAISRILAVLIGIYILWTRKSKLKKLLKISQNGGREEKFSRILITCVTILFLGLWITDYAIHTYYHWSKEVDEHARDINKILIYGDLINYTTILNFQSKICGSLYYCLKLYSYYLEELCELAILTIAFTVHLTCSGFYKLLQSKTQDLTKISLHYRYVKKITDLINEFLGLFLSVYVLGFMCYLLTSVIDLLKGKEHTNIFAQYFLYLYFVKNLAILLIAAEANRKVYYLKDWLFQYKMEEIHDRPMRTRTLVPEMDSKEKEQLYKVLSLEISTTQIGLATQFFTITYAFIAMLLSIFATYLIIQLEFYKDKDNSPVEATNKTSVL